MQSQTHTQECQGTVFLVHGHTRLLEGPMNQDAPMLCPCTCTTHFTCTHVCIIRESAHMCMDAYTCTHGNKRAHTYGPLLLNALPRRTFCPLGSRVRCVGCTAALCYRRPGCRVHRVSSSAHGNTSPASLGLPAHSSAPETPHLVPLWLWAHSLRKSRCCSLGCEVLGDSSWCGRSWAPLVDSS